MLWLLPGEHELSASESVVVDIAEIRSAEAEGIPILWVDVRPRADYEIQHWDGAIHFSEEDWLAGLDRLMDHWEEGQWWILYCEAGNCNTSIRLALRLREELGFSSIYALEGGWPILRDQSGS
nr:rhodanese-like domain-containing protein [Puniceicoccus vermicola]